ncbi:MAG: S1/P1 nuclease [Alphaproteobacteria bacterium]|nr:S1/P1 nuclease [Alphaproteobacteria bacterium]
MNSYRSYYAICFLAAASVWQPAESWAWGGEAHQIIALVADQLLQTQDQPTHRKIAGILATDKSNDWTKTDIASEATWADALREKSPEGRAATSKWHYVRLDSEKPDLNKSCFGRPALPAMVPASHAPQDNCVVDKIDQFKKELREPGTSQSERLMALQFLLNLVGDVHDPLNTIERNDQTGSCVAVLPPGARTPVRLTTYWEDTLVAEAMGKDPVKAARQLTGSLTPAEIQRWSGNTADDWAQESYNLAKGIAYNFPAHAHAGETGFPVTKGAKDPCGAVPVYRLEAGYHARAKAAIKEQLAKAGVRLALVLRQALQ